MIGQSCAVHVHRDAAPLEVHHIWPRGDGGPNIATNRVQVCANGHSMIHYLLDEYRRANGKPPWRVRMRYGRRVRKYALAGWTAVSASGR